MTRKALRRWTMLVFFLLFVVAPIWGMMNCEGWNEGTMAVTVCDVDTPFLRGYAEAYLGFVLMAAFMGGIPIAIYLAVIWILAQIVGHLIGWIAIRRPDGDR